ncbi:hypothetical protein WISP_132183 [Willisornis vidua]|uniref:Nudix hydrolase domain-containing protein n=1 Tax=Willisornis vidua TaxID=1566151 RepID=A0ABQ9CV73_9PASS|nr:hypothetical protein WISP_132183 [Willisornis vidua]
MPMKGHFFFCHGDGTKYPVLSQFLFLQDHSHQLLCITEKGRVIVPIRAVGARPILDFPHQLDFSVCPVNSGVQKTLLVRNVGKVEARYHISAQRLCHGLSRPVEDKVEDFLNKRYSRLSLFSYIYQKERAKVKADPMLFSDDVFTIMPLAGEIGPNSSAEISVLFEPQEVQIYEKVAYCDISGRENRLPLRLTGEGLGPCLHLNFEVLDIGKIFVGTVHRYEAVLLNKGPVDAPFKLIPPTTAQGSCFTFLPQQGTIAPNGLQPIQIVFSSTIMGVFEEEFQFHVTGAPKPVTLTIRGRVTGVTLYFNIDGLNFDDVSFGECSLGLDTGNCEIVDAYVAVYVIFLGFPQTLSCHLTNASVVPITFNLHIPEDGPGQPSITSFAQVKDNSNPSWVKGTLPQCPVEPAEFTITPCRGTIPAEGFQDIEVTLCSNDVGQHNWHMVLDVDDVGEKVLEMPITARCVVPDLQLLAPTLNFGQCALKVPYQKTLTLVNASSLPGCYGVLPQKRKMTTPLWYSSPEPCGIIQPYSTVTIPITIEVQSLGDHSILGSIAVFGRERCPLTMRLVCTGQPPFVYTNQSEINFGEIQVLQETSQTLQLCNQSIVPAAFRAELGGKCWSIKPTEGVIPPKSEVSVIVTANLDAAEKFEDEVKLFVENSLLKVISVRAVGVGTTVVIDKPFAPELRLGPQFSLVPCIFHFKVTNKGRKVHRLYWSTEGFSSFRQRHPLPALTIPKGKEASQRPKSATPIFKLRPLSMELMPGQTMDLVLEAFSNVLQEAEEQLVCHAVVGEEITKKKIIETKVTCTFISPVVQMSSREITFRVEKHPSDVLTLQYKPLSIKNTCSLPFSIVLTLEQPFLICDVDQRPLPAQVFNVLPGSGVLQPGETQQVPFTFFGHGNIVAHVRALCSVEGGPTYEVDLTGEASGLTYHLNVQEIDCGLQLFNKVTKAEVTLRNNGKIGFTYTVLSPGTDTADNPLPAVPVVMPNTGYIGPGKEQVLKLYYLPGLPGAFCRIFQLQVGHLKPAEISLKGEAVFPRISMDLPWNIRGNRKYKKLLKQAKEKLEKDKQSNEATVLRKAPTMEPPMDDSDTVMDTWLKMEMEQMLMKESALKLQEILTSHPPEDTIFDKQITQRLLKVELPEYILDMGTVVQGCTETHIVRITNTGQFPVSFRADERVLHDTGFSVDLEPVQLLTYCNTKTFLVRFESANLPVGEVNVLLPIKVARGPTLHIHLCATVVQLSLSISRKRVQFSDVQVGQCQDETVRLYNQSKVPWQWFITVNKPAAKKVDKHLTPAMCQKELEAIKAEPCVFLMESWEGIVQGEAWCDLQIRFLPTEEGLEPRLEFSPTELNLGAVLPCSPGVEGTVVVKNPCLFPVEFYSLEYDEEYIEEEKILRNLKEFKTQNAVLMPPRTVGEKLPPEVLEDYERQNKAQAQQTVSKLKHESGQKNGKKAGGSAQAKKSLPRAGDKVSQKSHSVGRASASKETASDKTDRKFSLTSKTSTLTAPAPQWLTITTSTGEKVDCLSCALPEDLLVDIISERLKLSDCQKGVVFDGLETLFASSLTSSLLCVLKAVSNCPHIFAVNVFQDYALWKGNQIAAKEREAAEKEQKAREEEEAARREEERLWNVDEDEYDALPEEQKTLLNNKIRQLQRERKQRELERLLAQERQEGKKKSHPVAVKKPTEPQKQKTKSLEVLNDSEKILDLRFHTYLSSQKKLKHILSSWDRVQGVVPLNQEEDKSPTKHNGQKKMSLEESEKKPLEKHRGSKNSQSSQPEGEVSEGSVRSQDSGVPCLDIQVVSPDDVCRIILESNSLPPAEQAPEAEANSSKDYSRKKKAGSRRMSTKEKRNSIQSTQSLQDSSPVTPASSPERKKSQCWSVSSLEEPARPRRYRWIVPAHGEVELKIHFSTTVPGQFEQMMNFELLGSKRLYQLPCSGAGLYPSISQNPQLVFPHCRKSKEEDDIIFKEYVMSTKQFHFGPLLCGKSREWYKAQNCPGNCEKITILNNSPMEAEVHFSFENDGKAETFLLDPPSMMLKPNEKQKLTLWAYPTSAGFLEDNLICCIKENPEPVVFQLCCEGVHVKLGVSPQELCFNKLLLHRGIVGARTNFEVQLNFRAEKIGISNKMIRLEVSDTENILGIVHAEDIKISVEVYDVNLSINMPKGSSGNLEFGIINVLDTKKEVLSLKNKGTYNIQYSFKLKTGGAKMSNLESHFTIQPQTGVLKASRPPVNVEVLFHPTTELFLKSKPILLCQAIDPKLGQGAKPVATIPVSVSARAVFSKYSIEPASPIDFGTMIKGTKKSQVLLLENTGMLSFRFFIRQAPQRKSSQQEESAPPVRERKHSTQAALSVGMFTVSPCSGSIGPSGLQKITVDCNAGPEGKCEEQLYIDISGRDPKDNPLGIPFTLIAESCSPALVDDITSIFEQYPIYSSAKLHRKLQSVQGNGVFVRDANKFIFIKVLVGQQATAHFKICNGSSLPCDVALSVKAMPGQTFSHISKIFKLDPGKMSIPGLSHAFAKVTFSPQDDQQYQCTFTASLVIPKSSPVKMKPQELTFTISGQGNKPQVTVVCPDLHSERGNPVLRFRRLLLGESQKLPLVLRNNGMLPAQFTLHVMDEQGVFFLKGRQSALDNFHIADMEEDSRGKAKKPHKKPYLLLQHGQSAEFDVFFKPTVAQRLEGKICVAVAGNYEETHIELVGEGYDDDFTLDNLPGLGKDSEEKNAQGHLDSDIIEAIKVNHIEFGECAVRRCYHQTFTITNHSKVDVMRFEWLADAPFQFSPKVGHLQPGCSKDIKVTLKSDVPVTLKRHPVTCKVAKIKYELPPEEVYDWDDGMCTGEWVDATRKGPAARWPVKEKVAKTLLEPPHTFLEKRSHEVELFLSALVDYARFKLNTIVVQCENTKLFQTAMGRRCARQRRSRQPQASQHHSKQLRHSREGIASSLELSPNAINAPELFSIEPRCGTIPAGKSQMFQLRRSPGEVCFPGGKSEASDKDEIDTALREAAEEVGLQPEKVEVICRLVPGIDKMNNLVTPVVGFIEDTFQATPNPDEVSEVFVVPLEYFIKPLNYKALSYRASSGHSTLMHCFIYDDQEQKKSFKIWGLTAHFAVFLALVIFGERPTFEVDYDLDNLILSAENNFISLYASMYERKKSNL